MKRLSLPTNKIKVLYLEGWTITRLAKRYYCSYYAMWCCIQELGIMREKKHIFVSPSLLKDLYEIQGLTIKEIAKGYGVSKRTIIRTKKHSWNEIDKLRNSKTSTYTPILIMFLRKEKKMKIREVVEFTGLSKSTVCSLQKVDIEELRKDFTPKETTNEHLSRPI